MTLFHDARSGSDADIAGHEDRLRIAVAERLQLAQPSGENRSDLLEWQHGVDVQDAFGFTLGEALGCAVGKTLLEFRK